ncbi:MAG: PAS domain S-box protein [Desulfobacteraceae bacterium]|jgi:PAS domain S-box-containing protein|nr:PAS domain S-box protein [Desulfobacteraceae bacterium]
MTTNHNSNHSSGQIQLLEKENKMLRRKLSANKKDLERFQVILNSFNEWYYEINLKGELSYFSPSISKVSGYSENELQGKNYRDYASAETAKKIFQIYNNIYLTGEPAEFIEYEIFGKDGKTIYLEASVYLMRDSNGNPRGFQGFARDITDRKKMETALQESEKRYRLLADNITDVLFTMDINLNYTYVSPSVKKLRGYEPEELIGTSFFEKASPTTHEKIASLFKKEIDVEASGQSSPDRSRSLEVEMYRKDGSTVWIESNVSFLRDETNRPIGIIGINRDINERRLMMDRLRENEEKFRTLAERCPFAIMIYQEDYWVYANPVVEVISGYTPEEFYRMQFWEVVHPDYRKLVLESGKKRQSGQPAPRAYDLKIIHKTGRDVWVSLSGSSLMYKGKPAGLITIMDVSERKQADAALQESEEKYRTILENMEDGYFEVDIAGNFTFYNNAMCSILGYEDDELMGMNNHQYMDPENSQNIYHAFNHVYRTGESYKALDWELIRKDDTRCNVETSISLLKDENGQPIGFKGIARDITERKKSAKALKESETRYRLLADNVSDNLWIFDLETLHFSYISPSIVGITGFNSEEVTGKQLEDTLTPSSLAVASKVLEEEVVASRQNFDPLRFQTLELEQYHKSGATVWTEAVVQFIYDQKQQPIKILGVTRDISERKKLQEQLRKSQKMESLGLLAGGVAHDLNNVLSGIVSYPELLLMNLPDDSKLKKPLQTIMESGNRATAIVQDLLTIARGVAITKQPLKLNDLIYNYFDSPEFKKLKQFNPGVTFKTHLAEDLLNIDASDVHIRKVIMNLIANAAEAVKKIGNVSVSTDNRFLERPLKGYEEIDIGEYAVFAVADDGPGISTRDLKRIFEPFYTKKKMGRSGTGLGLSVVWNVMRDHKGYIDVKSDVDGTFFELYFPISREAILKTDSNLSLASYKGNGETILVVDDFESQREITSGMLDMLGYNYKAVSSGERAIEYLKENVVDLILLDMIMDPGINGYETYKRIIKNHPGQKAIILSGFSETDDVKKTQFLGAGKYLKKPIILEKLGMAIKEELQNF